MGISVFAIIFVAAVLNTTLAQRSDNRSEHWFEARQNQQILSTINTLRQIAASKVYKGANASNMKKLEWDKLLEEEAKQMTTCDHILNNEEESEIMSFFELSSSSLRSVYETWQWIDAPETKGILSIRNTVATTIEEMFDEVFAEGDNFNFFTRQCYKGLNCSRYLQLAWAEADKVGCSINSKCHHDENIHYLNCVFNIEAKMYEEPFMVGNKCSRCPDSAAFCDLGLCVSSCDINKSDTCYCPKTCIHPGVGLGVLEKKSCRCDCAYGAGTDCQDVCENEQIYENYDYCAEINTEEHCENDRFLQLLFCRANCDYGCKKSPDVLKLMKEHLLKE